MGSNSSDTTEFAEGYPEDARFIQANVISELPQNDASVLIHGIGFDESIKYRRNDQSIEVEKGDRSAKVASDSFAASRNLSDLFAATICTLRARECCATTQTSWELAKIFHEQKKLSCTLCEPHRWYT